MKTPTIEMGSNYSKVSFDTLEIYFFYKTPIAFWARGIVPEISATSLVVRENEWGPTTGKHLNAIDDGNKKLRVPGHVFEAKLAAVLKKHGLSG